MALDPLHTGAHVGCHRIDRHTLPELAYAIGVTKTVGGQLVAIGVSVEAIPPQEGVEALLNLFRFGFTVPVQPDEFIRMRQET